MSIMRAKVKVASIKRSYVTGSDSVVSGEILTFRAVYKNQYDSSGLDEDNTYALWTPSAEFVLHVVNPELFGKFSVGKKYYVDFTEAE